MHYIVNEKFERLSIIAKSFIDSYKTKDNYDLQNIQNLANIKLILGSVCNNQDVLKNSPLGSTGTDLTFFWFL